MGGASAARIGKGTDGACLWICLRRRRLVGLDVLILVEQIAATMRAMAPGKPWCEIGVWTELPAWTPGGVVTAEEGPSCVLGPHLVDSWDEARRNRWLR